jgi:1,4-alpha-glucan branching enzyme
MAEELFDTLAISDEDVAALFASGSESTLQILAKADDVQLKFARIHDRDRFGHAWRTEPLKPHAERVGWFEIDLEQLHLDDDTYEYEFVLTRDGTTITAADPFAEEITRFGGYRGVFHIKNGKRWRPPFSWEDEFTPQHRLPNNHEMVIYEMPMRWMENAPEDIRQVSLGTFEKVVFTRLDELQQLGINCIELLPVQDSADTLNWGYGTRFFFAPDLDMGSAVDLKFFVKHCHRRGIRVIFDVVMNHARGCPLFELDPDSYFLKKPEDEPGRGEDYSGKMFRYRTRGADGTFSAQQFHFLWLDFFIREFHADGFRIDEFRGIDHWHFIQEFRDRAWRIHQAHFPGRPFIVIAEDSWRRAVITHDDPFNPHRRKVTDSMWNFAFRDETRRLLRNELRTEWGQPSRRERISWTVSGSATWDDMKRSDQPGFYDLSQAVNYLTSHDVEKEHEKRIMNSLFAPLLRWYGRPDSLEHIRWIADNAAQSFVPDTDRYAHGEALERVRSAFALLLTSVGIPMILAGDEFGDVHDLDHTNWRLKMSDPVDWSRRDRSANNQALWNHVRALIQMRTSQPALQRNEIDFFYFHPTIDEPNGEGVFAYCRSRGEALGRENQIVVVANVRGHGYPEFHLPWPWRNRGRLKEIAPPAHSAELELVGADWAKLSIAPFQVRVFET